MTVSKTDAKIEDWVRICKIIHPSGDDKPIERIIKGYLKQNANIGDEVEVQCLDGEIQTGKLLEVLKNRIL